MTNTETMIKALRVLSEDIQSGDGVANVCVADAANMIENMSTQLAKANERVKELESYNIELANESREYQQRVHKLERSLEERTQYINTLADSIQKDINRVWILDGFVEQVSKVDCESFTEVFLIKDTASRLLRKEQEGE